MTAAGRLAATLRAIVETVSSAPTLSGSTPPWVRAAESSLFPDSVEINR